MFCNLVLNILNLVFVLDSGTDVLFLSQYTPPLSLIIIVSISAFAALAKPRQAKPGVYMSIYIYSATHGSFKCGELNNAIAYNFVP